MINKGTMINDKELYQQKKQAQLDEWKAEIDKLKAKADMASADTQIKINAQIKTLEHKLDEGNAKLSELTKATGEAYDSVKTGVESAWDTLASAFSDASTKFKK